MEKIYTDQKHQNGKIKPKRFKLFNCDCATLSKNLSLFMDRFAEHLPSQYYCFVHPCFRVAYRNWCFGMATETNCT